MIFRAALVLAVTLAFSASAQATYAANDLSCTIYTPAGPGLLARCDGPFNGPGGTIRLELLGSSPNNVTRVQLSNGENGKLFQALEVNAKPVVDLETVGVLFMDFNFDGIEDFALMEILPAGPNVPYLYYLYDPKTQRFEYNKALSRITSPEIEREAQQISSSWRNGAANHGKDMYVWQGNELVLVERREDIYQNGNCIRKLYVRKAGNLVVMSKGPCK